MEIVGLCSSEVSPKPQSANLLTQDFDPACPRPLRNIVGKSCRRRTSSARNRNSRPSRGQNTRCSRVHPRTIRRSAAAENCATRTRSSPEATAGSVALSRSPSPKKAPMSRSATKGAITAFTHSLSQTLAEQKIRVNAVASGPIWTPLIPSTFPGERVETFGSDVPLGRAGQPDEVAPCYVFLASEDAAYMTGQVLHPNGGSVVNG